MVIVSHLFSFLTFQITFLTYHLQGLPFIIFCNTQILHRRPAVLPSGRFGFI